MTLHDWPRDVYDAAPGLNWSRLSRIAKSPKNFAYQPDRTETSAGMRLGSLVHLAVLEPDRFVSDVVVYDGTRRGKDWEAFKAEHAAHDICSEAEHRQVVAIAGEVMAHPAAATLIDGALTEVSATAIDPVYGPLKARFDGLNVNTLFDLKTSRGSVHPRALSRTCRQYQYHGQLAYYQMLAAPLAHRLSIIAVETVAPYEVAVYYLSDDVITLGHDLVASLLRRWKACQDSGQWGDEFQHAQELTFPSWAYGDEGDALEGCEE